MKKPCILTITICLILSFYANTLSASILTKTFSEVLEQAAKVSGRVLTPAAREAAELALKRSVTHYGDDILRIVKTGGLETLEQGAKYGDDFWLLCKRCPNAARSFALHADELMPLAKRIGVEVAEMEAKAPGLTLRVASEFGDDAVRSLSKAPVSDITQIVGYAQKTDSPAIRESLLTHYLKSADKTKFLNSLDWKVIMSSGLSIAVITAAYNISDGIHDATNTIAENSPETLPTVIDSATAPFRYIFYTLVAGCFMYILYLFRVPIQRLVSRFGRRKEKQEKTVPEKNAQ